MHKTKAANKVAPLPEITPIRAAAAAQRISWAATYFVGNKTCHWIPAKARRWNPRTSYVIYLAPILGAESKAG